MNVYDTMAIVIADCTSCGASTGTRCRNNSGSQSMSTHWFRRLAVQKWRREGNQETYLKFRRYIIEREELAKMPEYGTESC